MVHYSDRPIPLIDLQKCDGCGLCVRACPTRALEVQDEKSIVSNPLACEYSGLCESVCPTLAISRPFEIVSACNKEDQARPKPIKVVEQDGCLAYNASRKQN